MKFKDVVISEASTEAKVAALAVLLDKELLKLGETVFNVQKLQGPKGDQGLQGPKGEQGDRGFDGAPGVDGANGADGRDGEDGKQGVGVQNAHIDFDGALIITLTDGTEINAGDVVPMDVAEKIKVIGSSGGTSQAVFDAVAAIQAIIATYGTMALQNKTSVDIEGGTIDGTPIGSTVAAAGTFTTLSTGTLTATGQTSLGGTTAVESLRVNTTGGSAGSNNYVDVYGTFGSGDPLIASGGTGANAGLGFRIKGTGAYKFATANTSSNVQFQVSNTASAVNYVQVTGAATGSGNYTTISSQGSDAAVNLRLSAKGTSTLDAQVNSTTRWKINSDGSVDSGLSASGGISFKASATGSQVNYLQSAGGVAGSAPVLSAQGSDTNISQVFQSKGTGAIDLAAGSSGVNISNGGTVTAITGTAAGSGYTSFPTPTVSAPTTAGGVQAVVAIVRMFNSGATIQAGGTGYTVNDVLTVTGGTPLAASATLTVTSVSAGVITGISTTNQSTYTALPTNPVSVTGGTGFGATFNLTWAVVNGSTGYSITNAGSGYVEQPTVTFSGGGGSGAAAYATVGGTSKITGIGAQTDFYTPSGPILSVLDGGVASSAGSYLQLTNSSSSNAINRATGTGTNLGIYWLSKGTGVHAFATNNSSSTVQMQVAHTASAVNYVQVTGAATGNVQQISAQGSDVTTYLGLVTKGGSSYISFYNNNAVSSANTLFRILGTPTAQGNYLTVSPSVSGSGPVLASAGGDTNIDLTLTPKGTGRVKFGTYTANMALTTQGYIEILDSGGTVRKLAVIA
jgi:hypothetical protein